MKKLFRQFFYVPKHAAVPERVFLARTALSVVSVVLCLVMLCATTLAWFSDSSATTIDEIKAATFGVKVKIGDSELIPNETTGISTYNCAGYADGGTFTFTLTATGDAMRGYCVIKVNGNVEMTVKTTELSAFDEEEITLGVTVQPNATITFEPCWGTPAEDSGAAVGLYWQYDAPEAELLYGDGDTIFVSESQWVEYFVEDGTVTLEDLATFYGVDAQDILDYNGISWLELGQTLRIPDPVTFEPFPSPSGADDAPEGGDDDAGDSDGDGYAYPPTDSQEPSEPDSGLSDWEQGFYVDDYEDEEESWSRWE